MDDPRTSGQESVGYEAPEVEDLPSADGPAVTAAGDSPPDLPPDGPEWRGGSNDRAGASGG